MTDYELVSARCAICGDPRIRARRRCATCLQYLRRNGRDRPFELIVKLTERDIERDLARGR